MVIFDIETKLQDKKQIATHCGYLYSDQLVYIFNPHCINNFIDNILNTKNNFIYLYAHNFANFDSFFVIPILLSKGAIVTKMYVKNNNIIFFQCLLKNKQLVFKDSFLYASISLSEILKMFN